MKNLLIILIFLSSCSHNSDKLFEKVILNNNQKKVFSDLKFSYPKMANYHPLYFGVLKYSIELNYFIQFIPPPPPPPSNLDSLEVADDFQYIYYEYQPGEFDNYFMTGCFYKNYPSFDSSETKIFIDTSRTIANAEYSFIPDSAIFFDAYPVFVENVSPDTIIIGTGSQIHFKLQAKKDNNNWIDIETPYRRMCGTGIPCMILPKGEFCISSVIKPQGGEKMIMRLRLGNSYSNEFFGNLTIE